MRIPSLFAVALACAVAPLTTACGSVAEGPTSEISQAASSDFYLKLSGVDGEVSDHPHRGELLSLATTLDGTATAEVITDCVGPLCRVVPVSATLISNGNGPVSVWHLVGDGPQGDLWTGQLVVREKDDDSAVVVAKRLDVSGLALTAGPNDGDGDDDDDDDGHGHGHGHGHEHGHGHAKRWEPMASESLVTCTQPSCDDQRGPESWICLPDCTLTESVDD